MIIDYQPGNRVLHRANASSKMLAFVAVVAAVFISTNPWWTLGLMIASIAMLLWLGLDTPAVIGMFAPLAVIVVFVFFFAAISYSPDSTVVLKLWPQQLALTVEGISHGANMALRIIAMVAISSVLLVCTPIEQFTTLLQQMRCPNALVFIVITGLRFIPTMQTRAQQIMDAQRIRGARIDSGGVIGRIRAYVTIMVPLFVSAIRTSEELASAMMARGYGATKHPTRLHDMPWRGADTAVVVCAGLILSATVTVHVIGWPAP